MICVLAGGVGAARFLRGLVREVDPRRVCAVVNTGDDLVMHGLHISPDLDTVTYTLAGAIDSERQWGLAGETWASLEALRRYTKVRPGTSRAGNTWFGLGDKDLATHLYRTARLAEGATLTTVTAEVASAWDVPVRIVPMTDDAVATVVEAEVEGENRRLSFQEYFVQHRHSVPVRSIDFVGASTAHPTCLDDIGAATRIIVAPSNPLVSIGPIRALAGVDRTLQHRRDDVVAISPIVAGTTIKGPADRMMSELGLEASVGGIARLYASICGTLIIDERDAESRDTVEKEGLRCIVIDTIMNDVDVARRVARAALDAKV